jgi:hypothetical protein
MANPKNKWGQPAAPPPPMFFGNKERNLVKQVNDELVERVVGQTIAYYPISIEESNFSDVYGEALDKVSLPPIRVYAFVEVESEQSNEVYGYEYQSKLTVNFHRRRLVEDQNLFVRVGDFVQYGDEFYEIVRTYNDTRYYFGQVEHKFQISAECVRARKGVFRVEPALTRPTTPTVQGEVGPGPDPRDAPYPPLDADYITVTANSKLPNERVLTAGAGISLTDAGAGGAITIASTAGGAGIFTQVDGSNAYTTSSATIGAATTPTNTLTVVGTMSASSNVLIGGNLTVQGTVIGSSPLDISGSINIVDSAGTVVSTIGSSSLGPNVMSASLGVLTNLTASGLVSASLFYGDGSNLAGVGGTPGGSATQVQYTDGSAFQGSANLTFDGTTLTGSYTGSLTEFTTLSASLMNLGPISGTLAGPGSYLSLDTSNNVVLSPGDGATTSPATPLNSIQFNAASSFGGSSKLTFDLDKLVVEATASISSSQGGFLAIGLSTPGVPLHVYHDTSPTIRVQRGTYLGSAITNTYNEIVQGANGVYYYSRSDTDPGVFVWTGYDGTTYTEWMRLTAAGDMGVGTASPQSLLNVSSSGDQALFQVDGATAGNVLFVTGSGRVGIGTSTPSDTLTVVGAMSGSSTLQVVGATIFGSTLNVSGSVGIGTDAPETALHVYSTTHPQVKIEADDHVQLELVGSAGSHVMMLFDNSGGLSGTKWYVGQDDLPNPTDDGFSITHTTNQRPQFYIHTDGNIGIGLGGDNTTPIPPPAKLQVSSSGDEQLFRVDGSTEGAVLFVTGSGRVGIGTTSPGKELTVVGEISASAGLFGSDLTLRTNAESSIASIYIEGTSGTEIIGMSGGRMNIRSDGGSLNLLGGTGNELHFGTDNTDSRMVMDTDGNLGIGTWPTTPSDRLTVVGGISGSSTLQAVGATTLGSTLAVTGSATLAGGIALARTTVKFADSPYTVLTSDYYIGCDSSSGAITLALPAAATAGPGKTYMIKDETGAAATNEIIIDGNGSETIDGQTTKELTSDYVAVGVYSDGFNWFAI